MMHDQPRERPARAVPTRRVIEACTKLRRRCQDPTHLAKTRAQARAVAIGAEFLYPDDHAVQVAVVRLLLAARFGGDAKRVLFRLADVLPEHPMLRVLGAKVAA